MIFSSITLIPIPIAIVIMESKALSLDCDINLLSSFLGRIIFQHYSNQFSFLI